MNRLPDLSPENSPLTLVEMLYSTPIRNVMTTSLITLERGDTMRKAQELMRANGITGMPVSDKKRLLGIVSIHDLISAIEVQSMDVAIEKLMSTSVVTLEEEMPLSMAISYFGKYPYGRFPVLSARQELTGIITVRDINVALINRLMQEVNRYESMMESEITPGLATTRLFHTRRHDFEHGGRASTSIKKHLTEHGVDRQMIKRVAIASYELEMNQVVHSIGGTLSYKITPDAVEILAQDRGPGIANVDEALQEGFTTADDWIKSLGFGAGLGLPNARRVADEFYIHSQPGVGTTVKEVIYLNK